MSTQRGNVKKQRAPRHQNSFAFRHNPKSKKTQKILAAPIQGLCEKCHAQIEWRKKYRKYKPLTQPATCADCHQKTVKAAYHTLCEPCAKARDVCAKCCETKEIVPSAEEVEAEQAQQEEEQAELIKGMSERERRAYLRANGIERVATNVDDEDEDL